MENHHFSWANHPFLWGFSIAVHEARAGCAACFGPDGCVASSVWNSPANLWDFHGNFMGVWWLNESKNDDSTVGFSWNFMWAKWGVWWDVKQGSLMGFSLGFCWDSMETCRGNLIIKYLTVDWLWNMLWFVRGNRPLWQVYGWTEWDKRDDW